MRLFRLKEEWTFLEQFENKFCRDETCRTFHFFFESNPSRLEIRVDSTRSDEINKWINEYFKGRTSNEIQYNKLKDEFKRENDV